MADIARAALVSKDSHRGLLTEETLKNGHSDGSNSLTECSVTNHTNSCSIQNCLYDGKEDYQEIDSFSDLSFHTTDEISLQDILESEFAARISNINAMEKSRDSFDDLFEDYCRTDSEVTHETSVKQKCNSSKIKDSSHFHQELMAFGSNDEPVDNPDTGVIENFDDFISGPMQENTFLITDCLQECVDLRQQEQPNEVDHLHRNSLTSVNVFKSDDPEIMPVLTNFDPFTAVEEDSDCSNPTTNSNVLNSPEEFPFPVSPGDESDYLVGIGESTATPLTETTEKENSIAEINRTDDAMRELFTKRVSDDNSDDLTGQNYEGDEDELKLEVKTAARDMGTVDTFPNVTSLLTPDSVEVDEFFSSEDIFKTDKVDTRTGAIENGHTRITCDHFDVEPAAAFFCDTHDEQWTTVGEVLKAQPENFELDEDDPPAAECKNVCTKKSVSSVTVNNTNDTSDVTTLYENGVSETDSEVEGKSESSEKKAVRKKKSKKGKKSEEKENISVEQETKTRNKELEISPTIDDFDDLSNVSVKNLMLTYSSEAPRSLQNRRCSRESEPLSLQKMKARSVVDLTCNSNKVAGLHSNLFRNSKNLETSRSTTNLSGGERHPVVTGVSVQALKSSFSKFDQLSKKTILHVRSVDTTKVQKQFNEASTGSSEVTCHCKSCGKAVFQMEQIKAEKSVWHKNCFRCKECNKQLSVDTYSSNEGILYCKPHFRELFKPKAVLEDDTEPVKLKKPELIIRENQPIELPPEVVRASDKPDLGLDELASLNVKSRYQMFEKGEETNNCILEKSCSTVSVKRSPSILSKLAKFQKKGIDVGVRDEDLNGLPLEQSSTSSEEEEEEDDEEDGVASKKIIKSKKGRERPMSFSKMGDVKSVWENGVTKTREEMREERKAEIHQIRSKLFMGKQVKMKEAYEQAVRESESQSPRKSIEVRSEKAKSIKECFEKGEPLNVDNEDVEGDGEKKKIVEDDMSLFEAGISKKSRSLFLEMDKSAKTQAESNFVRKVSPKSPNATTQRTREISSQISDNIVKSSDAIEDVQIETADISSKFKFFETYKEPEREKKKFRITPPREGQVKSDSPENEVERDPNVVRASDKMEHEIIRTNTTTKMLSLFRQMEEKTDEIPDGPKPLKRFTPPPDFKGEESEEESGESEESEEDEEQEEETNPKIIRASDKVEDEYLKQAANAARAKQLRAKFEKWEEKEKEKEEVNQMKVNGFSNVANGENTENSENVEVTSIECTKSLRARFESMKSDSDRPKEKIVRPKINRFVEIQNNMAELCDVCKRRVYQLEKVETSGKIFHKACFRCMQCNCLLRMETFTLNCGNLYCMPHFKQKFISKGNYDEGFGVDQHKAKWPTVTSF